MQWTVRDVPSELDARLRLLAKEKGTSLNRTVLQVVQDALGRTYPGGRNRDLNRFLERAGRTNSAGDLQAMDQAWKEMEAIHPEDWR